MQFSLRALLTAVALAGLLMPAVAAGYRDWQDRERQRQSRKSNFAGPCRASQPPIAAATTISNANTETEKLPRAYPKTARDCLHFSASTEQNGDCPSLPGGFRIGC
jgi:hypothetical protein